MKRLAVLLIAAAMFFPFAADAGFDIGKVQKELPPALVKEVSQIPPKPHFLLGLEPKTDEWEAYLEKLKVFHTKDLFYGKSGPGLMDKSNSDYHLSGNTEIGETIVIEGKKVNILYTHHRLTKDGMHVFWSRIGEKNLAEFSPLYRKYEIQWGVGKLSDKDWQNVSRILGWTQFEAVRNFLHESIKSALKKNIKDYMDMNLTSGVIEERAKLLDDPKYGKRLDEAVPGTGGLKVHDILPVPLTRAHDFLPDLIIVGPRGFYGGFTNLGTPGSEKLVFLDLLGLALRYVSKWPLIEHEFVHANPYLQGTPMSLYYDVEMWAALTTQLESGVDEFLSHAYLAVVRDMVRTYFGYDFEEAARRIWPTGAMGASDIREKEFRANAVEVKKISEELLRFVKDPKDGIMAMFYRDPYFWIAVNTKYCDNSATWRILFSLRYMPTGIYDPDKKDKAGKPITPVVQTMEWLSKEIESGRIKELASEAMKKMSDNTDQFLGSRVAKILDTSGTAACPVDSRSFFMPEKERLEFVDFIAPLAERAQKGDMEARILLWRIFGSSGILPKFSVTP